MVTVGSPYMVRIESRQTLSERVAGQLRTRISEGEFPVGSLLPSENALAEDMGVSRNCVREALRALVHSGLLGARAGYGTFVVSTSDVAPTLARHVGEHSPETPEDVAEVRAILEREGARLAADRATGEQVAQLQAALAPRQEATSLSEYARADIEFHRLLMEASGNSLLAELYRGIRGNEQALLDFVDPAVDVADRDSRLVEIDDGHRAVVAAVAAHDPQGAAEAADRTVALVRRYAAQLRGEEVE
jgi:DNA-binding FadR family transcriptional regulator